MVVDVFKDSSSVHVTNISGETRFGEEGEVFLGEVTSIRIYFHHNLIYMKTDDGSIVSFETNESGFSRGDRIKVVCDNYIGSFYLYPGPKYVTKEQN
jgi:hypothetical protein